MIPISDNAGERHGAPWLTITLIIINALAFLYTIILDPEQRAIFHFRFGVVPYEFTHGELFDQIMSLPEYAAVAPLVPSWMTLFTSMFLHGGWAHILGNMVFLWVFGDNLERHFGRVGFLVFYLATGVLASAHISCSTGTVRFRQSELAGQSPGCWARTCCYSRAVGFGRCS